MSFLMFSLKITFIIFHDCHNKYKEILEKSKFVIKIIDNFFK